MNLFSYLTTFPLFRWLRYVALALIVAAMFYYCATCEETRERHNYLIFAFPLGFLVNAVSAEIIFRKLRKPPE